MAPDVGRRRIPSPLDVGSLRQLAHRPRPAEHETCPAVLRGRARNGECARTRL